MQIFRLIVLVDIPVATRHERKVARDYHDWLFANGFTTLQEGVYTRVIAGRERMSALDAKLRSARPEYGTVRLFTMTETQFGNSVLIAGQETAQEEEIGSQIDIFL